MKKLFWLICLMLSGRLFAQSVQNKVQFATELNWEQVIANAKHSHKMIFVDAYATWCGPCRQMDNEVFTNADVAEAINKNFIAVKIQMDSTINDNKAIRDWRATANAMAKSYQVNAFPTFLFFTSEGKLAHKAVGFKKPADFTKLVKDAENPDKQEYTLLEKFNKNELGFEQMPPLIDMLNKINDRSNAKAVMKHYVEHYLVSLPRKKIFTKEKLIIIGDYLTTDVQTNRDYSTCFNLFYQMPAEIDQLVEKDYAERVVRSVITQKEVLPALYKQNNGKREPIISSPDWVALENKLATEYDKKVIERVIIDAKIAFYSKTENWPEVVNAHIRKIEKYGLDTAGVWGMIGVNNLCFSVFFKHADDPIALNKALGWIKLLDQAHPDNPTIIDTYANLLYKLGNNKEAIAMEAKALRLNEEEALKRKVKPDPSYQKILNKMSAGEPTWTDSK